MSQTKKKTVKLKHVAEAAGVSLSTASRALSGKAIAYRISAETEKLVLSTATKLDFHPSQVAQSFRTQKTKLLGVVLPDVSNPFFASIAREVTTHAEENGYSVLLADSRESTEVEQKLIAQLQAREIEGLVISPVGLHKDHLDKLHSTNLPVILVDRGFPSSPLVTVTSDHREAAKRAMKILIANGHQKIGVLQGIPGTLPNEERLNGIREELKRAGLPFDSSMMKGNQFSESSGYKSAKLLLNEHSDITALFALSNQIGLGALRVMAELGKKIPDEISIITFDDHPYSEFLASPMTTVRQDVKAIGRMAAELIIKQIKTGRKPRKKVHLIPVSIVERASVFNLLTSE